MLDTNTIAHLVRRDPRAVRKARSFSAEAEVRFGVAKRPTSRDLRPAIEQFFAAVELLPWTRSTASVYSTFRAEAERRGRPLGHLDMMIAAHALEQGVILATSDRTLLEAAGLSCEDWLAA